ncbi:hypothetical protein, partial [Enterobacter kobei]|uniref:hypothetical protein n=1 Tax=Enterobacter kobei TaxID=208224 RepID=UPI001EFDE894
NQPRRDDFGLKIGKLSHRTSIKDGLGRHIGSCGPLNRNFLRNKADTPVYQKFYKYYIPVAYKEYYSKISAELPIVDVDDVNNNLFGFDSKTKSVKDEGGGR